MASLPTGARIAVATALAEKKPITAISNAAEAVVTSAAHGLAVGDIIVMHSGWERLNQRVQRVKSVVAPDEFTLEGTKTTSTTLFPAGAGIGTFQKITTWVDILQVLTTATSGGEARKVTYRYLGTENDREINDGFTAVSRQLEIDADAISTAGYEALVELTETGEMTVQRVTLRNGAVSYFPCTVALNEEVVMQEGQVNRVRVDFSGRAKSTRFAA